MPAESPTKFLKVPGGTIAYEDAGSQQGAPVVLIHQAIADRRAWEPVFSALIPKHRVVRYDLRGFGESSPAEGEFSSLEDLHALLVHLKIEKPLLVGASMGGRIALDYVVAHPRSVSGLLLIAPGFSGMDYPMFPDGVFEKDDRVSKAAQEAFSTGKLDEAIEQLRGLWAAALAGRDLESFQTMVRENANEVFLDRSAQHDRRVEPNAAARLSTVEVPLLVLVGDRDNPAMPHVARYLVDHVQHGRVRLVPGADHLMNLGAPQAVADAVEEMTGRGSR